MIKKLKITKYPKIEKEDRYCWGVYGIFDKYNDELLYIGSTKNLRSRQQDHCKPCNWKWGHRELDFRIISYHENSRKEDWRRKQDMLSEERKLIRSCKPLLNIQCK